MDEASFVTNTYQVPQYKLEPGEVWFHFLHGNVPGHQIDFMYRPEVPQAPLTRQHFSHLARVVKYIEPRHSAAYSFAITNLSRDDNQYEPGHGGVGFVFGLRINGARDHAGRQDPPFCHSAVLVDRHLDAGTLYSVAVQFYQKLLPDEESHVQGRGWYHTYVQHAQNPAALIALLNAYVNDFRDMHAPQPSRLRHRWTVEGASVPRRVTIVHPDRVDFPSIAGCMARFAEVLIESDIKWTAVSTGREQDVPGGLTVRFVPRREAVDALADEVLLYVEQMPTEPAEIAFLFNAHEVTDNPRMSRLPPTQLPNRPNGSSELSQSNGKSYRTGRGPSEEHSRPWAKVEAEPKSVNGEHPAAKAAGLGIVEVVEKVDLGESIVAPTDWAAEHKKNERQRDKQSTKALIATMLFVLVFGGLALVWVLSEPKPIEDPLAGPSATVSNKSVSGRAPASSADALVAAPSGSVGMLVLPPSAAPSAAATSASAAPSGTAPPKSGGRSNPNKSEDPFKVPRL